MDAETMGDYQRGRNRFPESLARTLGEALARLHRLGPEPSNQWEALPAPWVLSIHRPNLEIVRQVSSANLSLIRLIQRFPELGTHLDDLRQGWQTDAFIHGDLKWDNLLVIPTSRDPSRLKIVDWEFAGSGDPCWDVGSVFSEYLGCWLLSLPLLGNEPAERFLDFARYPLPRMQPAIRAFWNAYAIGMNLNPETAATLLDRSMRYAAARMIQTGYERMQMSVKLDADVVCMLQVGLNILRRPQHAAMSLLGIAEGWRA